MDYRYLFTQKLVTFALITLGRAAIAEINPETNPPIYFYRLRGKLFRCAYCRDEDAEKQNPFPKDCYQQLRQGLIEEETHGGDKYSPLCLGTAGLEGAYYKNCTSPPSYEGVKAVCQEGVLFNQSCTLTSTKDHFLVDPPTARCQANGSWTEFKLKAEYCLPIENLMNQQEKTNCPQGRKQRVGVICNVTDHKSNAVRSLSCDPSGQWNLIGNDSGIVKVSGNYREIIIAVEIGSTLVLLVIFATLIYCKFCRRGCKKVKEDTTGVCFANRDNTHDSDEPLLTIVDDVPPPYTSGSYRMRKCSSPAGSRLSQKNDAEPITLPSNPTPLYEESLPQDEQPVASEEAQCVETRSCNKIKVSYQIDDNGLPSPISENGVMEIVMMMGQALILSAECSYPHEMKVIILTRPGNDTVRHEKPQVRIIVDANDHNKYYHLYAECVGGGIVICQFKIIITGGDIEQTIPKMIDQQDSSTLQMNVMDAGSGLSEKNDAQPKTLPSNPTPLFEGSLPASLPQDEQPVASGGDEEMQCDDSERCTLPLSDLVKDRRHNQTFKMLKLKLEPTGELQMSAGGLVRELGIRSDEEVRYVIWAKRTDLLESPACVHLALLMQHGKTAHDVITYFSQKSHKRVDVIELLLAAHPNCCVCSTVHRSIMS